MRFFIAAIAVCVLAGYAHQATTSPSARDVVSGRVTSDSGTGLSGVKIELLRDGHVVHATLTDHAGEFRFAAVSSGKYLVRATLPGFAVTSHPVITVGADPVPVIALTMNSPRARDLERQVPSITVSEPASRDASGGSAGYVGGLHSAPVMAPTAPGVPFNTEAYAHMDDNRFHRVATDPVSTFSIDVDSASYSNVRRFLAEGRLPPEDAVRSEELLNYFRFTYAEPKGNQPFAVTTEIAQCPWNPRNRIALVGLQARRLPPGKTPARNLVFLLDVSGSMMPPNKLPLVKSAMRMLVDTLTEEDRVAIVVYAGETGLALPSTPGNHKSIIQNAIAGLRAGGPTNGASGIRLAYNVAAEHFIKDGINRVILATDGDFNVGVTSEGELVRLIEEERARGIFLSVIGVSTGNLKDSTMEKLANKGNGNYSYFDTLQEARRVLVAEGGATLVTVAKDVKIQIEFNPAKVGAYRLIGYENRLLNREDFNDDRKDAGAIGAGHTVTALYELIPPGDRIDVPAVDPLQYQSEPRSSVTANEDEAMTVKLRYQEPTSDRSELITIPVKDRTMALSANLGFAAAVAEFGMLLRRSEFLGHTTWDSARALARQYRGEDPDGYRAEFIRLLDVAAALDTKRPSTTAPER